MASRKDPYKMNLKTNLLEDYVNFVDLTKKQNRYFKKFIIFFVVILCLFLFFVSIEYNTKIIITIFFYELV